MKLSIEERDSTLCNGLLGMEPGTELDKR